MKKIFSLLLALGMCLAISVSAFAAFDDVASNAWYAEGVAACYDYGIVTGTSETTFSPDRAITRGEFVTMLFRMHIAADYKGHLRIEEYIGFRSNLLGMLPSADALLELTTEFYYEMGTRFSDVDIDAYYSSAVSWAVEYGYATGTSETSFAPNEPITREQMMAMLYRYELRRGVSAAYQGESEQFVSRVAETFGFDTFGKEVIVNTSTCDGFSDGYLVSSYAREGVSWALQPGYVTGVSNTMIDPNGIATRAQVVTIFERMLSDVELGLISHYLRNNPAIDY